MQAEGLGDFLEAVAAGGVGLRHGAVALRQRGEMCQWWPCGPPLRFWSFRLAGLALGVLLQRFGKVVIAQVKLAFQVAPYAGQADTGAHMVDVCVAGCL